MAECRSLERKLQRSGLFDERRIDAWLYEDERGICGWHVRTWPSDGDPIDEYWVEQDEFFEVTGLDLAVPGGPDVRIETSGRKIIEMDEGKRSTILNALAQWVHGAEGQ